MRTSAIHIIATAIMLLGLLQAAAPEARAETDDMVTVPAGDFLPFYADGNSAQSVPAFRLDRYPVTNAQFLAFIQATPRWRRDAAPPIFVDKGYLRQWGSETQLGSEAPANHPVTRVSWFAARAYCRAQGKRLPTQTEWEYAGRWGNTSADGLLTAEAVERQIRNYANGSRRVEKDVTTIAPDKLGLVGMHELVWEWVEDFEASSVVGGDRGKDGKTEALFCGGAVLAATDSRDYAAFMRYAFRSSLQPTHTLPSLGFRCAADIQ